MSAIQIQVRKQMLKAEMDGVANQIKVLYAEINLREAQIKDLWRKYSDLNTLKQNCADELLEKEYNFLVERDL